MKEFLYLAQLVLAAVLGGILGWQREVHGKAAGARTYALVTAGSALFTILSVRGFPAGADASRVASQILVGVGFIGAGTILHRQTRIEGLTTAAGLWMAAAIGMAVGLQMYILSAAATIVILLLLIFNEGSLGRSAELGKDLSKSKNKR